MKVMNSEVRDQTVPEGERVPAIGLGQPSSDWSRHLRALLRKRRSWPDRFLLSAKELISRARRYREDRKAADRLETRFRQLNSGSQQEMSAVAFRARRPSGREEEPPSLNA